MAWSNIATRTTADSNSETDVNQLMENARVLGGNSTSAPDTDIQNIADNTLENSIINGGFHIAQRGTSFAAVATDTYTLDRWQYIKSGSMVHTITQASDAPINDLTYSIKHDCTTASGGLAAGEFCHIQYAIEGYDFKKYVGNAGTLSFWVKATKTGTHCVAFMSSGQDKTYIAEYTVSTTNTWELKEISLTFDYSGGTWDYVNGVGLRIYFSMGAGATYQSTADSWLATEDYCTSNQVDDSDNTANNFSLAGVKMQLGSDYTEFRERPFDTEVDLCQRYYEKSYNLTVDPGTSSDVGMTGIYSSHLNSAIYTLYAATKFMTRKRTTPTIVEYDSAGAADKVTMQSGNGIAAVTNLIGEDGFRTGGQNGGAATIRSLKYHFTADAEL